MIRSYTSQLFERDRVPQWLDVLHTQLRWPAVIESVDEKRFQATIEAFSLGELVLLNHSTSALSLRRLICSDALQTKSFSLNYVTRGRMTLSHHDRHNRLAGGDLVLADNQQPSRLTFEEQTRVISVRIPRDLLAIHVPRPELLCNVILSPAHEFTKPIRAALLSLLTMAQRRVPEELQERSVQPFLGILSFAYLANFGPQIIAVESCGHDRLGRIRRYIDAHIGDVALTPTTIASTFNLSARYLRKLFAAEGESFTRYVQRRRLERTAEQMVNRLWKERSITEICYDSGFKSAPHFTRAFKAHFGVTPTEYRRHAGQFGRGNA